MFLYIKKKLDNQDKSIQLKYMCIFIQHSKETNSNTFY
jgi:hypothetical protein